METSLYARYVENVSQKENGSWTRWLDANAHGKARSANSSGPEYYRAVLGSVIHRPLFSGRAMRVRIALEMHRLDHAGQYPETLHSLVPQYLEAVPEDPRTGGPLAWDPKAGVIYAAGENWKQQLPPFKNPDGRDHGGWLSDDTRYPGLRLKRPVPPL